MEQEQDFFFRISADTRNIFGWTKHCLLGTVSKVSLFFLSFHFKNGGRGGVRGQGPTLKYKKNRRFL